MEVEREEERTERGDFNTSISDSRGSLISKCQVFLECLEEVDI